MQVRRTPGNATCDIPASGNRNGGGETDESDDSVLNEEEERLLDRLLTKNHSAPFQSKSPPQDVQDGQGMRLKPNKSGTPRYVPLCLGFALCMRVYVKEGRRLEGEGLGSISMT